MRFATARFYLSSLLVACLLLTACAESDNGVVSQRGKGVAVGAGTGALIAGVTATSATAVPVGAVIGGFAGAALGQYYKQQILIRKLVGRRRLLITYLAHQGIQTIQIGDDVAIILPTDRFFSYWTPNIKPKSHFLLNYIAELMRFYDKMTVQVAGYTDKAGSAQRNLALSRQQAENLGDYLWAQGMDTRIYYAKGYGDCNPIADNMTPQGRAKNRRIEIRFHRLPRRVIA